ncbi:MAG: hypothetical protein JJU03_00325 [Idiomarina sp.]|nr:hypothetical protein [Idiomarina sp.]
MKPYKNLKSENLGLLLFTARATAIFGFLWLIVAILFSVFGAFIVTSVTFIPAAIGILFMSGLMAAIVAFEENYRIRTEHMLNTTMSEQDK